MSAINLRNVKRDFSQLNFRPDIYHPDLINELSKILVITGKVIKVECNYKTFGK